VVRLTIRVLGLCKVKALGLGVNETEADKEKRKKWTINNKPRLGTRGIRKEDATIQTACNNLEQCLGAAYLQHRVSKNLGRRTIDRMQPALSLLASSSAEPGPDRSVLSSHMESRLVPPAAAALVRSRGYQVG